MNWRDFFARPLPPEETETGVAPLYDGAADALPAPSADPDWIIVKRYIRERLIAQRRALETRGMSLSETEGHRHAIFELEGVLNCLNPSKMQASQSE